MGVAVIGNRSLPKILVSPLSAAGNINLLYSQSETKWLKLMGGKALSIIRFHYLGNIKQKVPSLKEPLQSKQYWVL
jgi:hypothetical protein